MKKSKLLSRATAANVEQMAGGGFNGLNILNRNVRGLPQVAGQEYMLMYPLDGKGAGDRTMYESSPTMTFYRRMNPEIIVLPAGTYYFEYEVNDMLTRPYVLDRIEFQRDGEKMTFPDDLVREGTETLTTSN